MTTVPSQQSKVVVRHKGISWTVLTEGQTYIVLLLVPGLGVCPRFTGSNYRHRYRQGYAKAYLLEYAVDSKIQLSYSALLIVAISSGLRYTHTDRLSSGYLGCLLWHNRTRGK